MCELGTCEGTEISAEPEAMGELGAHEGIGAIGTLGDNGAIGLFTGIGTDTMPCGMVSFSVCTCAGNDTCAQSGGKGVIESCGDTKSRDKRGGARKPEVWSSGPAVEEERSGI